MRVITHSLPVVESLAADRKSATEPDDIVRLGNASDLTRGLPNGRWQDGSFNPTRYKQ